MLFRFLSEVLRVLLIVSGKLHSLSSSTAKGLKDKLGKRGETQSYLLDLSIGMTNLHVLTCGTTVSLHLVACKIDHSRTVSEWKVTYMSGTTRSNLTNNNDIKEK